MKPYGIIYKAINLLNGEAYIGQTTQDIERRWKDHLKMCKKQNNIIFYNAIRKYGKENFIIEQICKCQTKEILDIMETFYIIVNKSHWTENGYNVTWGGNTRNGYFPSEETKRKISKSLIGKHRPKEVKKKISKTMKGRIRPIEWCKNLSRALVGIKKSEEHKRKLSEAQKGNRNKVANKRRVIL